MLCANTANAQTSFSVTPSEDQADIMVGDTVTVHVTVTDFTDIATYQFSINWTTSELSYLSIHSLGLPNLSLGDFGPNAGAGFITTSWSAPGATEYTSPDTCIFAVDFIVESTAGITGDILITSNPTTIEVVGLNNMGQLDDITSTVTFVNGTATVAPPSTGQCDFGGGFGQSLDSADVQTGNQVCLTVYACGFDDIVSAQYSINWDPADLQFSSTTNYNLQNLDASAFNFNNAQGWMTFSWLDSLGAGTTVPDLTPIYDVCFTAIGSGGTVDTVSFSSFPSNIEITDLGSMGSPIPFNSTPGLVNITGNAGSAVTVSGSCETAGENDEVCIQMTTQNFDSIVGMQYTMHWDPSVLEFSSVGNLAYFLGMGDINVINDSTAIFQFNDFGFVPHSLMNGDTLYAMCFNVIGSIGETGTFTIDGSPITEEATQIVNGNDEVVPLITQTCNVEIVGFSNDLNIFASTVDACPESPDDTVYVTYTTTGFISVASMQFDLTYDVNMLDFIGSTNINPGLPGNHQFISQANGDLRYSWFEPNTNALNLMDNDTMFQLCFKVIGDDGQSTTFSYDYGGVIEITDGSNLITAYTLHDGAVNITNSACPMPVGPEITGSVITDVDCNGGTTGAIDITVENGMPGYTYAWMPNGETTEDLTGLAAGTYTVVVTDMASISTTETFTVGEPTALTATTTQSEISCNGLMDGGATVSPAGGSPTYTYLWDNGETTATVTNLGAGESCVTVTDDSLCTVVTCVTITQPTAVTATLSSTDSNCGSPTGTVTATPAGGSGAGYTYLWDTGAMTQSLAGVSSGNYCVTITDGDGCTAGPFCETVGTLSGPTVPALTSTDATCAGSATGSLTAAPTGGTPPYNYAWSTGGTNATENNLLPGMHTVTVTDAAGCDAVENGTVGAGDGISTDFIVTDASCADNPSGIVTAQPADGSGTYTYLWAPGGATSQGISGLVPGAYTVTVTDGVSGCTVVETATVGAGPGSDVTTSSTDVSCPGLSDGTATATPVSGTGGYTFLWFPTGSTDQTISTLPAGNYTVTMTDAAGCTDVSTTTVGTPSAVVANAYVDSGYNGEDISCNGASDGIVEATGDGGNPGYTYAWSTGDMTQQVTGLPQGNYTVTVTDSNGCTDTDDVFLDDPEPISLSAVVTDEDSGNDGAINLSDSGGTGGFSYTWSANAGGATTQDLSGLAAGEYCVTVTDGNNCEEIGCYTVNPPNALDITLLGTTPESCFNEADGTINITSTGTAPFTYVWSPVLPDTNNPTTASQGTYSVTVTDNVGITGVESGILVGGPTEAINITTQSTTDVSCNGGADACITVDVSGGNGAPYTVDWGAAGMGTNICGLSVGAYTPTVTDSNGCTAVGTLTAIDQPDAIVVTIDQVVMPSCGSGSDGEVHISAVGGTGAYTVAWQVDNVPVAGNTTMSLTGLDGGTVTGTVTDANGCVVPFGPITLVQEGSPTITIDAINQPTCSDDTGSILVTVAGGLMPYTYVWTDINSANISGQEDLLDIGPGSYILTVEDANDCIAMTDVIVIVAPDPVAVSVDVIMPASSDNDDGSITMNPPSGGTAPYTYEWTNSAGTFIDNTLDISGLAMDVYTLVVTDINGCTTSITAVVEGSFTIPPSQVVVTNVTCAGGDDGAIDISIFGGTAPYTFFWDNGEITEDLANLTAGEYCVTVTDATGLLAFGCWTVTAPDQMTIQTVDVTHETGNGCNGSIDITVDGGTPPYTYTWSNGDDNQNPVDLCKGAYFVTVVDANGCIIVSNQMDVFPPPMTIEDPIIVNEICAGDCTGSINLTVFGGCAPYDFELTNNTTGAMTTATDLDGINETLGDLCPSSYSLVVVDADPSVNTPALAYSFTILAGDVIVVELETDIDDNTGGPNCNGAINIMVSGGSGNYDYEWSNTFSGPDPTNLCSDGSPYSVTVTDNATGCIGVLENLIVNDAPFVSESNVTNITCVGDENGAIDIEVEFGVPGYTYIWNTGESTQDLTNKPAGMYTVTVTDAVGTTSVFSYNISEPSQALSVSEDTIIHPTGTIPNGSININVSGGWGNYTYEWSNGATSMDLGGLAGDVCYTVTVTDGGGCEAIIGGLCTEAIVLEDNAEITDISCNGMADAFICSMIDGGEVGTYTYLWSNGETEDCIYEIGPGTYTLTVTDANGLTNEFLYNITEPDSLQVSFTTEPSTATATAIGGTAPYNYTWNTNPQTEGPTIPDQATGTYAVVVTDANGCTTLADVDVTDPTSDCDEVRTILSPNGDGRNDNFLILCARVSDVNLEVFNRWGQLVYEATNYDNSWEGTDQSGNVLPEGGYMYVITYNDDDGKEKQAKGHLTLIKSAE